MGFPGKSDFGAIFSGKPELGLGFSENGGDSEWGLEDRNLGFKKGRRRSGGSGEELRGFIVLGFLLHKKK